MPSDWYGSITLIDSDEKKTTLRYTIGTLTGATFADEAADAQTRFTGLVNELKAVTDANVYKASLRVEDPGDWGDVGLPADADVSDELVVAAHTNDSLRETETDNIRIPAPIDGLFVGSEPKNGIDPTVAALQTYVANFESDFMFSDGEHVNTAEGTAGIAGGYWRSVKKSIKQ